MVRLIRVTFTCGLDMRLAFELVYICPLLHRLRLPTDSLRAIDFDWLESSKHAHMFHLALPTELDSLLVALRALGSRENEVGEVPLQNLNGNRVTTFFPDLPNLFRGIK